MMKDKFSRQRSLISPEELEIPITVIGAGGIGSWTTLALAKMGCSNLVVLDDDKVELRNTASQIYSENDVGKPKTEALKKIVFEMTGTPISIFDVKWQKGSELIKAIGSPIIISALDSIETRKELWEDLIKSPPLLYIDGRMQGELIRIYVVRFNDPKQVSNYPKSLVPKSRVDQGPCTARAVAYNTFICAGLIATLVKKFIKREALPSEATLDLTGLELMVSR